jgi:hypothetical protein
MITKEQAQSMTLGDIKALRADDFILVTPFTPEQEEAHKALLARFNELDPEFDTFLQHARPDLMSNYGSPDAFLSRIEKMSPFELVHTYSVLTSGGIDDLDFCVLIHKLMGRQVAAVFVNEPPAPIQAVTG